MFLSFPVYSAEKGTQPTAFNIHHIQRIEPRGADRTAIFLQAFENGSCDVYVVRMPFDTVVEQVNDALRIF